MIVRMRRDSLPLANARAPATRRLMALGLAASLMLGVAPFAQPQMRPGSIDNLPSLGEASVDELSPAAEQRLGDQIFQEFLRMGVVHDDPETTDFLSAKAMTLLQAASSLGHTDTNRPFRFFLVKDATINAFALPGGYIGTHTGLITASDKESEVMSVLAHEIGHVTQRHIARMFGQQRQSSAIMIAAAVLAAMAASASPDAAMGVLSLGQTMAMRDQLSFSRDAEREADRVGIQILAESGYDPRGMSSMFERLSQAGRVYDNNAPAYLRTHPLTTERIADIQGRLQTDFAKPGKLVLARQTNSPGFDWLRAKLLATANSKVDGLRSARLRAESDLKEFKNAASAKRGPILFGAAHAALLQRDFAAARSLADESFAQAQAAGVLNETAPFIAQLRLRIAVAAGDAQEAARWIQEFSGSFSNHRAVVRALIEAQLLVNTLDQASALARSASQQWPQDPQIWTLLARVEGARGRLAEQHAALAEQYALSGALAAAVEQLTIARKAGDGDFVTMSKIDSRLTVLRAKLRQEQIERQQSAKHNGLVSVQENPPLGVPLHRP